MAGSFLSKAMNWLNKIFRTMGSPISGFGIDDVKVKENAGEYSALLQFNSENTLKDTEGNETTTIKNEGIELDVLLITADANMALRPLYDGMNHIGESVENFPEKAALIDVLLGDDRKDNTFVENSGKGLLGMVFDTGTDNQMFKYKTKTYDGKSWSWGDITDDISFSLECQSPGKEYGAIASQDLSRCGELVAEYLVKVGIIASVDEVSVDPQILALPILKAMQESLIQYFKDALAKYGENCLDDVNPATAEERQMIKDQGIQDNLSAIRNPEDNGYGEDGVVESKHIDVTLQKITGTTSFNMTAIRANYSPSLVLEDMDEIVGQPEFIDALLEEPTTYSIDVDEDGFDIEPCDECMEVGPCEGLCEVFKAGIRAYRNLYIIHWMSNGNDMMKLHTLAEEMYGELIQEIDTIGELLVEKQGTVPQLDFPCDYIPVQDYDFQTGLDQIQSLISMYIDCIDYAYCNQDSDVQSTLDEWLRYWKKQLNYFVERQEI